MTTIEHYKTHLPTTLLDIAHLQHGSLLLKEFFAVALSLGSMDLLGKPSFFIEKGCYLPNISPFIPFDFLEIFLLF